MCCQSSDPSAAADNDNDNNTKGRTVVVVADVASHVLAFLLHRIEFAFTHVLPGTVSTG